MAANHPEFLDPAINPNLLLTEQSEVWSTFVSESASNLNSFGYFTYPDGAPPASAAGVSKVVVFSNARYTLQSFASGSRCALG